MSARWTPPLTSEHAQMLELLLHMVGPDGVRPADAAQFLSVSVGLASEVVCTLRDAGRAVKLRNRSFPRVFVWCLPEYAAAISRRMAAEDEVRNAAAKCRAGRRLAECLNRTAGKRAAAEQQQEDEEDAADPFYAPLVRAVVPAATAPRITGGVPSVFHLGALLGQEAAA